jgi:hypothetical protein
VNDSEQTRWTTTLNPDGYLLLAEFVVSVSIRAAAPLELETAAARARIVAAHPRRIPQTFGVLLVRSAKSSEPVVNRLPTVAQAVVAVSRGKQVSDPPQQKNEQHQTSYRADD